MTESRAAQRRVATASQLLSIPTLWLVPTADPIADPEVTRRVYAAAGGEKALRIYEGLYHEPLNELARDRVLADVEAWLLPKFPVVH